MQNFGKFKKISALNTEKTDKNTTITHSDRKNKRNTYLIVLEEHNRQVRKVKDKN